MNEPHSFKSGKYAGRRITDPAIPLDYLEFMTGIIKPGGFRAAIVEEVERRGGTPKEFEGDQRQPERKASPADKAPRASSGDRIESLLHHQNGILQRILDVLSSRPADEPQADATGEEPF